MASISLKVHLCSQQTVKTLQFDPSSSVHEACQEIRRKLGDAVGGEDHALFWPTKSKWLVPTKTLAFYELAPGDTVEFKKKHRMLRIRMLDDTVKTVLIDDSLPVLLLAQSICSKIGIANQDEYSLALEEHVDVTKGGKKKVTDSADNVTWLNPEKSLPEQGVEESATLLLKKKFFYSDQNVDRTDPIQLHLIYQQSRDGIISGKHACTVEEAVQFAALQMQIVHGNHDDAKHKLGFLNLREFLPEEYRKAKDIEKRIYGEHRKLVNMPELTVKHRYVQLCRSLKTYGVTFFSVKEKDAKKNKVVARLIGISKDAILRCDAESKEVLQTWPLTSLRRWAASPTMFTMDFGDYQDAFYSVQTTQGEQMSQLIAGYIDIIIKRKKEADRAISTGAEEVITTEEVVRPARAQAIAIKPAQVNTAQEIVLAQQGELASDGANAATVGQAAMRTTHQAAMSSIQPVAVHVINPPSPDPGVVAVLQRVTAGQTAVQTLVTDMTLALAMPVSSRDASPTNPTRLFAQTTALAHLASHLASAAAVVQATSIVDTPAIAHHVAQLSTNLSSLGAAAKTLHANGAAGQLPELTRDIANATNRLLATVQEAVTTANPTRETLLAAAQAVTTASVALLTALNYPSPSHVPAAQRKLQDAAKQVSVAMQDLVNKAKKVAGEMATKEAQMRLIEHVKLGASAASQVAVSSAILAPLAATSICKQGLAESANAMRSTVDLLVSGAATSVPPGSENLANLRSSAQAVSNALDALLQQASVISVPPSLNEATGSPTDAAADDAVLAQHCGKVRVGCTAVQNALGGEPGAMVAGVKSLTMSSTELVNALKRFAALAPDDNSRNKLVDVAKALAEATTRMVSAAKESARNPQDVGKQDAVKAALDSISAALQVIQHPDSAAVTDMLAATQSLVVSAVILACDPNVVNAQQLAPLARKVLEGVREHSVVASSYGPGVSPRPLMNSTRALADSVQALLLAAMQVPEVAVASAAQVCAQDVHTVGSHVGKVANLANALELAAVVQTVSQLKTQTVVPTSPAQDLPPLDLAAIKTACKDLGSTLAQLVGNATQGKDTGETATRVQVAITSVVQASSGMPQAERSLVVGLLDESLSLLNTVQTAPRDKASLADAVKALNGSVVKLLEGATQVAATKREAVPLPGPTATASTPVPAQAVMTKDSTREAVVGASSAMVTAISQLVTAKSVSGDIKKATGDLESAFRQLVSASKLVIPQANAHAKAEILELVQAASVQCVELIGSAKQQQASVQAASPSREALSNAASTLGASVNKLMEKCAVVGSLGDVEVIRAMQALEMAAARLASPMLPTKIGDLTFSECLGKVVDDSRQIAQIMSTALKSPSTNATSPSASVVSGVSNSASALSSSTLSVPIDQAALTQLCQVVASIADTAMFAAAILSPLPITSLQPLSTDMNRDLTLLESATTQQAVLDAASGVGVATNGMCTLIKTRAASLSVTEQERAQLVEMATSLASASQHLIHAVKAYAVNMIPETKAAMVPHIPPVRSASDKVYAFSTEAAGPIRAAARKVVESGRNIVLTSDRARVVQHAAALGHHLSGLVTSLRDVAPGQRELAAALDQVHTAIAGVDEQLLASAVEGTKVALCNNPALIEDCQALNRIVFGWTTESARIERDPARPVHAADAYTKVTQSIMDSAMLDLVKAIGNGLLRVMDNLKFSRPPDALPAVEVGEDLVAILELRNQMYDRVMAPLNNSDSNSPDALQAVQSAAKDLVALISKCKTPAGLRMGQFAPQLAAVFDRLCQVAKACEEQTNDVVIRDRLHGSLERLGAAVIGVLLDRSKVSQLSSAIQALVATVQESVRAAAQCLVAQRSITASLLPSLRETIAKVDAGESIQVGPVAPGALQLRCNQLLESLHALVAAAESNMDATLGDAAEGSVVILKQLVEDARKHAAAQQSADTLKTVDEILGSWSTLVQVTSRAVTKPPSDSIFDSVRELANKISRLTTALTSNESQQEFQKLASVLEAAIKALPMYENELRAHENGADNAGAPPAGSPKSAEEWEQVRNVKETRAVAVTTFDLIKSAAMCQREVSIRSSQTPTSTPTSPTSGAKYMDDGTWSDGLVSAAKQVAQAMQELIATATPTADTTQPAASRERLIACAKAVASATVQVVAAASVKSEANAPSLVKLKSSAKTVVQTAETMVNKIKTSNEVDKGLGDDMLALKPSNQTSARLALLEAQTSVLTMEAELERARARLTNIKKARYSGQPDAPAP